MKGQGGSIFEVALEVMLSLGFRLWGLGCRV